MNWLDDLMRLPQDKLGLCDIPDDLGEVTLRGREERPEDAGLSRDEVRALELVGFGLELEFLAIGFVVSGFEQLRGGALSATNGGSPDRRSRNAQGIASSSASFHGRSCAKRWSCAKRCSCSIAHCASYGAGCRGRGIYGHLQCTGGSKRLVGG